MRRRELLSGGAAMVGMGALAGCAPSRPANFALEPGETPPDMDEFVRELDLRMESMNGSDFVRGFATDVAEGPLSETQRAALEPKEKLFRGMLRSLYVTQTFRDLPDKAQQHPAVQDLMHRHIDEVDQTVTDVTEMLAGLDDDNRARLQKQLRARPDLGMQVAEEIDNHAAKAGVSRKRRMQLRSMMAQTTFRLKHASPSAVIDEYVEKVERMKAQDGAQSDLALRVAAQASRRLFWQQAQDETAPAPRPPPLPEPKSHPVRRPADPKGHPGSGTVKTGAILLGIGAVTAGISGAIFAAGGGAAVVGAVGLTIGAILFAVGLIVLIVGAIISAASDPPPVPDADEDTQASSTW